VVVVTRALSPWVRSRNARSLRTLGGLSADIQESLSNFRVIAAFNRTDYFRRKFDEVNADNFSASVSAGMASGVFMPIYGFAYNAAQLVVLGYGITLATSGGATVGLLVGFMLYVNSFYLPLRQIAALWASLQLALAAVDRIAEVLALESDLPVIPSDQTGEPAAVEFRNVAFHYPGGKEVLRDCSFVLQPGKTYAMVGPTGGGKTTTACLMARLYDPSRGTVLLDGRDIRSWTPAERAAGIGFILQEPFLFTGTIRDNILYGNADFADCSNERLAELLRSRNLGDLLARFPEGLDTRVASGGDTISLGQKQLVAFMRAVLRSPRLLILDEATANIDTVTEQLLDDILAKLPASTTKVIIAHRLNTIAGADEIFFINAGEITLAGSMEDALDMLMHGKRES
jgi:ATP-binding cassette subfamily B protein